MDRDALVLRNRAMADAFHRLSIKHQARRAALRTLAAFPFSSRRSASTKRVLLMRPDHLGDVLLTLPAIQALKTSQPDLELHALVGPWSADVLANCSALDAVLTTVFPGFSRTPKVNWRSPYQQALNTASLLRRIGYDAALILRPDHWWGAMTTHLAGIPNRIGYDQPDTRPFLTQAVPHQHQHAVLQSARLIETFLKTMIAVDDLHYRFPIQAADDAWITGYLEEWGVSSRHPLLAIHPGSGTWVKRWDEKRWALVADTLHEQLDVSVILTGSDHELPMISQIVSQMKHQPTLLVGDATINQLAALYARCTAVLGPDSGPLHLAAAVGTATVTLFGPADPIEFGPWGPPDRHLVLTSNIGCRPCRVIDWGTDNPEHHPCVRDISIDRVLDAARRVLQRHRF